MKPKLLLIESDVLAAWEEMRQLMNEGFAVSHARSLAKAIELLLARPERSDLILADPWKFLNEAGAGEERAGARLRLSGGTKAMLDAVKSPIAIRDADGGLVCSNASYDALRGPPRRGGQAAALSGAPARSGIARRERLHDVGALALGRTIEPEEFFDEAAGKWRGFLTTRVPLCGKDRVPFGIVAISVDLVDSEAEERPSRGPAPFPVAILDEGWDEPALADLPGWPTLEFAAV